MRRLAVLPLMLVLLLAGACGDDRKHAAGPESTVAQPAKAGQLTPEQLGQIGADIRKEPGRAEEILAGRGLDKRSFEKQIRALTENPEASRRYAAAYRRASA
jgi:hypothetical protein